MFTARFGVSTTRVFRAASGGGLLLFAAVTVILLLLGGTVAVAQQRRPASSAAKTKIPPPEECGGDALLTRDGVALRATFYPGTKGKETVPVILLHTWKGSRKDYATLAPLLQEKGHAVLVPDLRGHGQSNRQMVGSQLKELDASRFRAAHFASMVRYDMETLKSFLMKKHNAEELNIEKLCLVGAEMGASVALDWARLDWSWPRLVGKKQGQDVQALVLISPQWSLGGFTMKKAMAHQAVRGELSIMMIVGGQDSRATDDVRKFERIFERFHPDQEDLEDPEKDLVVLEGDTNLQGTRLLDPKNRLRLNDKIVLFLEFRMDAELSFWKPR